MRTEGEGMTDHVRTSYRRHRKATWVLALALGALALSLVPLAAADDSGNYPACLQNGEDPVCGSADNSSLPAGTTGELTLTVTNASGGETDATTLGSVNLSAPPGIAIDPDTVAFGEGYEGTGTFGTNTASQIELRTLNLDESADVSVTFDATASCVVASAASDLEWTIEGAHPEDSEAFQLSGTGLVSDITGTCKLVWVTQPKTANVSTTITGAPYTPGGAPVAVGAEDALGTTIPAPSGVTLAKTAGSFTSPSSVFAFGSVTLVSGEARFGSFTSSDTGSGFRVRASASGFDSTPESGPRTFSITLTGKKCVSGQNCSVPTTPLNNNSQVNVTGTGGSFVFLGVGPTTIPASVTGSGGGCQSYTPLSANGFELAEERSAGRAALHVLDQQEVNR